MHKLLKNICVALGLTSLATTAGLADITFNLTPQDISGGSSIEVVGGTITTNGTVGEDLALGTIVTDWSIVLTNGIIETTLLPTNSFINASSGTVFDVTNGDITFDPTGGNTGVFQVTAAGSGSFYAWYTSGGSSYLHVGVSGASDYSSPAPGGTGNVAVPEPSTVALWMAGIVGAFVFWQKRRK